LNARWPPRNRALRVASRCATLRNCDACRWQTPPAHLTAQWRGARGGGSSFRAAQAHARPCCSAKPRRVAAVVSRPAADELANPCSNRPRRQVCEVSGVRRRAPAAAK
jgi:hypothetical protein